MKHIGEPKRWAVQYWYGRWVTDRAFDVKGDALSHLPSKPGVRLLDKQTGEWYTRSYDADKPEGA